MKPLNGYKLMMVILRSTKGKDNKTQCTGGREENDQTLEPPMCVTEVI
jgi:hypothetical protein